MPAANALDGLRALLVDDEDDSRGLVSEILSQYGARVRDAASADQALDLLDHERFDVIVSDIAMPQRDGYQLIQEVRGKVLENDVSKIPAIALTAYARPADRRRALRLGYNRHLAKPVHPTRLVTEIVHLTREMRQGEPRGGDTV